MQGHVPRVHLRAGHGRADPVLLQQDGGGEGEFPEARGAASLA